MRSLLCGLTFWGFPAAAIAVLALAATIIHFYPPSTPLDCSACEPQRFVIECTPCSGTGADVKLNTVKPIPLTLILTWDLCFDPKEPEQCWHSCPGTIEESVFRGGLICKRGGE